MTTITGKTYQEDLCPTEEEPNYYNQPSEISTFYSGKKIFITGGLGFLGRLILEKLLSSISKSINSSNRNNKCPSVDEEIPIYNAVSSVQNPITWGCIEKFIGHCGVKIPSKKLLWYYSLMFISNYYVNFLLAIFVHWIPAIIVDSLAYLSGKKPILLKIYGNIHKFQKVISFFTTNKWKFTDDNVLKLRNKLSVVDKYNFYFNISDLDWENFFDTYIKGLRVYLFSDPMETVEKSFPYYKK
ncbi:hypothetical protein M0802_005709 [Mischocyttarus mexicanus]|nr:hypothetical protein M0802_005709 [Mischocyttarus mexicanus]